MDLQKELAESGSGSNQTSFSGIYFEHSQGSGESNSDSDDTEEDEGTPELIASPILRRGATTPKSGPTTPQLRLQYIQMVRAKVLVCLEGNEPMYRNSSSAKLLQRCGQYDLSIYRIDFD